MFWGSAYVRATFAFSQSHHKQPCLTHGLLFLKLPARIDQNALSQHDQGWCTQWPLRGLRAKPGVFHNDLPDLAQSIFGEFVMRKTRFLLSLVLVLFVSNALAAKPDNKTAVCHIGSEEGPGGETYDPNCVPTLENNYFCADAGKVDLITVPNVRKHLGTHEYDGLSDYLPEQIGASGIGQYDEDGDGIDQGCQVLCPCWGEAELAWFTTKTGVELSGACDGLASDALVLLDVANSDDGQVFELKPGGNCSFAQVDGESTTDISKSGLTPAQIEACYQGIAALCDGVPSYCAIDEYVLNNTCTACPAGTTNAADDDASGTDTSCDVTYCAVDEFVSGNACSSCAAGTTNAADDDASGTDTSCDVTYCAANEHVLSNTCVACDPGTNNEAGDYPEGENTTCDVTFCAAHEYVSGNTCVACPANTSNRAGDVATGDDTVCDIPPTISSNSPFQHIRVVPPIDDWTFLQMVDYNNGAFVATASDLRIDIWELGFHAPWYLKTPTFNGQVSILLSNLVALPLYSDESIDYTITYSGFDVIKPDGSTLCSNSNDSINDDCEGPGKAGMLSTGMPITMNPIHDINQTEAQNGWDKFDRFPMWGTDGEMCSDDRLAETREFLLSHYPEEDPLNPGCLLETEVPFGFLSPISSTCKTKWRARRVFSEAFAGEDGAAFFSSDQALPLDDLWSTFSVLETLDAIIDNPGGDFYGISFLCSAPGTATQTWSHRKTSDYSPVEAYIGLPGLFIRGRLPVGHHYRIYLSIEGDETHPLRSDLIIDTVEGVPHPW
jgi:hypothetical protein